MNETITSVYVPFMSSLMKTEGSGGSFSGVLSESDFRIAEELHSAGYIRGRLGPENMHGDLLEVSELRLTVPGKLQYELWSKEVEETRPLPKLKKLSNTVLVSMGGIFATVIAGLVLYWITERLKQGKP
ncbi:hypothetical protein SH449x_004728 [Pirellulaceae bacterium SH449]